MKKLLIAGIAVAAFGAAPALAADMPVKGPVYKAPPPMFSWTGCYGGIEGGWARDRSNVSLAAGGDVVAKTKVDGGLAGGTLGCNWQQGNWVLGLETDLSWSGLKGTSPASPGIVGETLTTKSNWLNTDRVRIGYAADRSLWYLTGGAAVRDIHLDDVDPLIAAPNTDGRSHTKVGWTAGLGAEFALADPHWSWKIEYLHADFGKVNYVFTNFVDKNVHLTENIVRVGLNYRFDWGKAPVVAKY